MLSAGDAQHRILERIAPLDALELSITDAHGCVLAETVTAPEDLPPFPSAAADGFAIRSSDTSNAASTPVSRTPSRCGIGPVAPSGTTAGAVGGPTTTTSSPPPSADDESLACTAPLEL